MQSISDRRGFTRNKLRACAFAVLLCAGTTHAQSLNLDLGDAATPAVPSANFGGAAGQVGSWNGVPAALPMTTLHDLNGLPSSVVFTNVSTLAVSWNHAGTIGDEGALLDDLGDPGSGGQYRFDGLATGGYEVWTYAWAPDSTTGLSLVTVTSASEIGAVVGGAWPGAMTEGITHSVHHLVVTDGSILIDVSPAAGSSFASVNGFQLVYSGLIEDYCFGDGTAACPCGNQAQFGARGGCRHGGGSWVVLANNGTSLVSADDLQFYVGGGPPHVPAFLLQGSASFQWPFKDGFLCVGSPTERIEVMQLDFLGGASTSVSIVNRGQVSPGERRFYQLLYLDPLSVCGSGMNSSNALQVDWL